MTPADSAVAIMDEAAHRERSVSAPSKSGSMISLIERVLMDPNISMDRFERILALQKEAKGDAAKEEFNAAMACAQSEMRVVVADKPNRQTNSRYASYAALDHAVRPIYTRHGFSVTYNTGKAERPEDIRILADVSNGPHERQYHLDMAADGKGAKGGDVMTKTHAVMSALSYGKRGLLILIFNIPVADKWDDDGNAAGGSAPALVTEKQVLDMRDLLMSLDRDEKAFCEKVARVTTLAEIRANKFDEAMRTIKAAGPKPAGTRR